MLALQKVHTIGDFQVVDYALPSISGPGSTIWDIKVFEIQGKDYPEFMTLGLTGKLEFRPDRDEYSGRTFYWTLKVHERGSDFFAKETEMQISVFPPVPLDYEVIITDGATGSG